MILLRLVVLALTGILATAGLVLAVLALLAAQWLAVATVVVVVLALVWAAIKGIALISGRPSETDER
jgi:hypothetical protein